MFENPRRGRQARNFSTNVPRILDLKSSSEQVYSENCRWVPMHCVEIKMDQNDSIVSCPWLLCADTAASKWEQKARKSVYEIINSCLLYLSQSMRYLTSAYLRCPRKLIRCGSMLQFVCGLSLNFKYPPTEKNLSIAQLSTKRSVCLHFYSYKRRKVFSKTSFVLFL